MRWTEMTATQPISPRRTWSSISGKRVNVGALSRVVILIGLSLAVLTPLLWMILGAFKTQEELAQTPPTLLPRRWDLGNFAEAFASLDFPRALFNRVFVVIFATVLTLIVNSMAAYALANYNFRGKNFLFIVTLFPFMIRFHILPI